MKNETPQASILPHPIYTVVAGGLRSIAALIPGLSVLGQAWAEYENHRTTARIQELLTNMRNEFEIMHNSIAAKTDGLKDCKDFPELIEMTIDRVRKEFDDTKRARYARILARVIADGAERTHDDKVALIDSLDTLTEGDLRVMQLFKGKNVVSVKELGWRELGLQGDVNVQLWQLACSLARLESRGLILKVFSHGGTVYVPSDLNSDTARWQETGYRLLPLGESLIGIIFN